MTRWAYVATTFVVAGAVSTRWWDTPSLHLPVVQSAFPFVGAVAIAWAALGFVFLRRRLAFVLPAVVVALVPASLAVGTLRPVTVAASPTDEVVAASNLEFGAADPRSLLAELVGQKVSTLVLTEVTPEAAAAFDDAGGLAAFPHRVGRAQPGADGTVILSKHPLTAISEVHVPGLFDQPVGTVHVPAGDYTLRAMHPYPPTSRLVRGWHRQLGEAANWVAAQPSGTPLVLAGDVNSSAAHPAFRRLADGLLDAHGSTGAGWVRTWPQGRTIPPFVQLDHILVRDGQVVDAGTATIPGTDHALVWARLRLG